MFREGEPTEFISTEEVDICKRKKQRKGKK